MTLGLFTIGIHPRFAFHYSNEAGIEVLQCGWLIIEVVHGE